MKVSSLEIYNYKQFSKLTLDLTYPTGHPKAGKPLDKICIIGQSGTGKTNLLEIIKKSTIDFSSQPNNSYLPFSEFVGSDTDNKYILTQFETKNNNIAKTMFTQKVSTIEWNTSEADADSVLEYVSKYVPQYILVPEDEKIYFVSAINEAFDRRDINKQSSNELNTNINESREKNSLNAFGFIKKQVDKKKEEIPKLLEKMKKKNFLDRWIINMNNNIYSWDRLKARIDTYELEKTKYMKTLSHKLIKEDNYSKDAYKDDIRFWENKNENLLQKIATDINKVIKKFNLELHMNEAMQSYEELIIKDLSNNETIAYNDLSTGSKNMLSTFIPLQSYKPKDSIILIDEPEMSFYPDIQRELTDLYMQVGENNQLIMATHSPLIASSFEPWEVVELKFNDENQIYRETYYEGKNHVDNYTIDPRMLTWTGILTDVFELKEDSNFSFREKKLMEYATLKAEIKGINNLEKKEEKFKELQKISKILGLNS